VAFNTADGWMRDVTADIGTRAAISWSGRARESSPEPTPTAPLSYGGIFGDNSGGATPQRHRPSTRPSRRRAVPRQSWDLGRMNGPVSKLAEARQAQASARRLKPGTVLVRDYQGQRHTV